jgi:hypothetical protein
MISEPAINEIDSMSAIGMIELNKLNEGREMIKDLMKKFRGKEIIKPKSKFDHISDEEEWTNNKIKMKEKFEMKIDNKVEQLVKACLVHTKGEIEISIFVPYEKDGLSISVSTKIGERSYIIPKQENQAAAVHFIDDTTMIPEGYAFIHTHPGSGTTSFSTSDIETVNQNHELSLLYNSKGELCDISMQIELSKSDHLIVRKDKFDIKEYVNISVDGLENIKKKEYTYITRTTPYESIHDTKQTKRNREYIQERFYGMD